MTSVTGFIYGLHAGDGVIRYVGATRRTVALRLQGHLDDSTRAAKTLPVQNWIREVGKDAVQAVLIEECDSAAQLAEREIFWIATLPNLTNVAFGGPGAPMGKQTPEWIAKRIKRGPEHHAYGTQRTQEWKDALSAKTKGRAAYPASVASIQGAKHFNAKLTEDDVRAIRASTDSAPVQALRYGVTKSTIFGIRSRRRWKSVA